MKRKRDRAPKNKSVKTLRTILGQTQKEFANTIGVTEDAVKNWELGRNYLSWQVAQQITDVTGANVSSGDGVVLSWRGKDYSKEDFRRWSLDFNEHPERAAEQYFKRASAKLYLTFLAAAKKKRLASVSARFEGWLKETIGNFFLRSGEDGMDNLETRGLGKHITSLISADTGKVTQKDVWRGYDLD